MKALLKETTPKKLGNSKDKLSLDVPSELNNDIKDLTANIYIERKDDHIDIIYRFNFLKQKQDD